MSLGDVEKLFNGVRERANDAEFDAFVDSFWTVMSRTVCSTK